MRYELKLRDSRRRPIVDAPDGETAARRHVATHPADVVLATRPAREHRANLILTFETGPAGQRELDAWIDG